MEVLDCIKTRRSIRQYKSDAVSENDLHVIIEAGYYAPSGMNTQDRHFTAISNGKRLQDLNTVVSDIGGQSDFFYHAPVLIIVSAGKDSVTPVFDCAVALENMFLAAHAVGIASCWINALNEHQKEPSVRNLLTSIGVPADHTVYGAGVFGYSAVELPKAQPRKENIVTIRK